MARAFLVLAGDRERQRLTNWARLAPINTRVTLQGPVRSLPQNSRMWAMLTDVSEQVKWHGLTMPPDDWKLVFMDALGREVRIVPNLDGTGFVNLGRSSSGLSKSEMSDLMELIAAFGASHGVTFSEPSETTGEGGSSLTSAAGSDE